MNKLIEYFLNNSRLNYTLALFILALGVFAYITIPKEMFPSSELDAIEIRGSYAGASSNSLNNFAVTQIENEIENISGIKEVKTTIKNGSFRIRLDLEDGADKISALNEVKDALSNVKRYLPSDMSEPTASSVIRKKSLMYVSLNSKNPDKKQFLNTIDKIKTSLLQIEGINNVTIYGDTDLQIDIKLDNEKINMYGLNSNSIIAQIRKLSYMYPVANVEQSGNHIYMNADNDKFNKSAWRNTMLSIGNKKVYLSDIASVSIGYPRGETIARLNGEEAILFSISRDDSSDSIKLAKQTRDFFKKAEKKYKDIEFGILFDESEPVSNRLSIIISNITLGLILVGFAMYVLISARISFVIVLGIPFSFIIGLLCMEYLGISLNMTSLAAMLMALGIVVDDAIIVSENIQRYLDEGKEIKEAVLKGTKEMIMPVMIAAFTTIFAFLPMLYLSGRLGAMMKMIPIVMTILIIASLVESFLFLPLHAKHILKPKDKVLDWDKVYKIYEKILHFCINYKKSFLFIFFITVPLLTVLTFKQSRFQFFPNKDSSDIIISVKLDNSMSLEQSDEIAKKYEKILLKNKDKFWIDSVRTTVGRFRDVSGDSTITENSFTIDLELLDYRQDDFLQNWINPILTLSFDFKRADEVRLKDNKAIRAQIRKLLTPTLKKEKNVQFNILARRIGPVRTDIELKLSSINSQNLIKSIELIKKELNSIKGISDVVDNLQEGQDEYKYTINSYGQSLGLTDGDIASAVNSYFTERDQANTYNDKGIVKIKTQSIQKDSIDALKAFYIPLNGGKFVGLNEVVSFRIVRNFEEIQKDDGQIYKKVFANVDNKNITANEALEKLNTILEKLKTEGIDVKFGGEKEKSKQAGKDLLKASLVAMFLIFVTLLINFPSYKNALILLSVIPFTLFGALAGHLLLGVNLAITSAIGIIGLAGVVINDGIVMLDFLQHTKNMDEFYKKAKQRVRPIFITSITTFLGLSTLVFFPTPESTILQPIAISLGFGIAWGTVLNLVYVPTLYATLHKINKKEIS